VGFIGRNLWKATINPAYGRFDQTYGLKRKIQVNKDVFTSKIHQV
jgi:hypothetical protein